MGMPELGLPEGEYGLVESLVKKHGKPLDGQGYQVVLGNGDEEVVVLGAESLHASRSVVDSLTRLLSGGELFGSAKEAGANIAGIPPETRLGAILHDARTVNVLANSKGIKTVGQLLTFLGEEGGGESLDSIPGIGSVSVAKILSAIGR